MKRLFYLLLMGLFLIACQNDSEDWVSGSTVSANEVIPFEELLMLVNVKTSNDSYLAVKSIDSINIFVNGNYWARLNSQSVELQVIDKVEVDNRYETKKKLNYLVLANQDIQKPEFNTAGDVAKYLNSQLDLKPGEYACLIESFQVTFNNNTTRKYYPLEYRIFKVEADSKSAFAGEFELKLD